jgi:CRP/FNR family transcriptional regulator, cyclic AMP receptor protein
MKNSTCRHPFLSGMDPRHVQILLHGATEEQFTPGEILFREGEPANRFYLIESGQVALESTSAGCGTVPVQTIGAGEVLGWSWLFPPFAWHFQARAVEPTHALCCNGAHLLVQAEEHPAFGYALMKRISQILIRRLQATRSRFVQERNVLKKAHVPLSSHAVETEH